MKLVSCHVENFGKLHDYSLDFSDGLNNICEENGWGKTTFAAFLRAMFYGLEGERKRSIEENERKRYKPWQGGVFGGQLIFEIQGKVYQISRIFGDKEAKDEFELRDLKTNLLSKDYSNKIGEEIFKINRESFLRTIFIGQNACETTATDDINAKIGNLVDNSNDLNNFDSAYKNLTEILNALTPNRVTGSLSQIKSEITRYERIVQDGQGISQALDERQEQLRLAEENYERLKEKRKEAGIVQEKVSQMQSATDRVLFYQMTDDECEKLSALEHAFSGGIPTDEEIERKRQEASRLREIGQELRAEQMTPAEEARIEELETFFGHDTETIASVVETWNVRNNKKATLSSTQATLEALQASFLASRQQTKKPPILLIFGVIAVLLGILLAVRVSPLAVGIAVAGVGVVLLLVGMIGYKKESEDAQTGSSPEIEKLQRVVDEDNAFIADADTQIAAYLKAHGKVFTEDCASALLQEITEESVEYNSLKKKAQKANNREKATEFYELNQELSAFLAIYGIVSKEERFSEDLYVLKSRVSEFLSLREKKENLGKAEGAYQKQYQEIQIFLEKYGYEMQTAQEMPSLESMNQTIHQLTEAMDDAQKAISNYNQQLSDLQEQQDEWEENCIRLDELKKQQEAEQKKYKYVLAARTKLSMAKETMTAKYAAPILEGFGKYYKMISGKEADHFHVDANTTVTVDEMGKQREVNTLSFGYRDLIGICLRLALVDAMYHEEAPMLIMDDPFTNLDDWKIEAGKKFVEEIAEKYQIIYFTCSNSRSL
jgi:uncharacterized coiled-coil protein SlyX